MSDKQQGYLLVADISGYTNYLNTSELRHAHGTLTNLLELLIDHTRPPLIISGLEGDAVLSYGLDGDFLGGQAFVESIEDTYVAFRRAIEVMVLNNKCGCNACANVSSLDVKFFVHHGSFLFQRLAERDELLGTDVILIHRLLKNTVVEKTGIKAYCLYTDAAVKALGIEGYELLRHHVENTENFGPVDVWLQDMHPVWKARHSEVEVTLEDSEVLFEIEADIGLAPEVVWDYMTRPEFRTFLIGSDRQEVTSLQGGRVGPGTTYQCFHGKQVLPQTILEWQPFHRIVTQDQMGGPFKGNTILAEYELAPTDTGTRLRRKTGRPDASGLVRGLIRVAAPSMRKKLQRSLDDFRARIESDWEHRTGGLEAREVDVESVAEAAAKGLERLRAR